MTASFSSKTFVSMAPTLGADEVKVRCSDALCLTDIDVLVVTSGHEATDHRVYGKQALSLKQFGANVTVVGSLEHQIPANVPVLAVSKPGSRLTRFLWQPWRCLWAARKLHADIIHFHDPEMLAALPFAKLWWRRTRFVYDVHEDFANLMLIRDWLPVWIKPVVKLLTNTVEKGLALLADAVVGVTPPLAEKFLNREKIVAYNYISQNFFDATAKLSKEARGREFDLVHLGTLNVRRARFLAETLTEFHHIHPAGRSLVIGVSPEIEKEMRERIPHGCKLLGRVSHEQIPGLLGNAKVGVDVHPWLGPHLEVAVPVKVCEYMAAGCAVVSSYMPVLSQILNEAKIGSEDIRIIDGGGPVDYARAAVQLVEAIDKGMGPGTRLRKAALKHMVWEKEAAKLAQLYLRLLGKRCAV
jgi:glycosyltransferase involved in cell wall biosynthesis